MVLLIINSAPDHVITDLVTHIKRVSCQSRPNEKCETYMRLKEEDVKELTLRLRSKTKVLDQSLRPKSNLNSV